MYTTQVREHGMLPSTGTVGDSYDNAMAESVNGAYKTELVWRRKPFADLAEPELATFRWVSWWNSKRLHQSLGCRTPEQHETEYHDNQAEQAVQQKKGNRNQATTGPLTALVMLRGGGHDIPLPHP